MSKPQITRDNHYVPQWYQKGFLAKGRHKLHILNLHPGNKTFSNGRVIPEPEVEELGPKAAFSDFDLYTTQLGDTLNDDIETFLFGKIDKNGADAVRGWIAGDPIKIHLKFQEFFAYMDAQKLRTPKGLDWILKHYHSLPQLDLMEQMQVLRHMHCTMWSEGVREIVSASKSSVKFLVSDHPITIYHSNFPPDVIECQYPSDPGIELIGSQTIFALDANNCLILTNIEYAENPEHADLFARRTNARFRGNSMVNTSAFIRSRDLNEAEVHGINLVLKSRAKKYVASSNPAWLYPEQHCLLSWEAIGKILLPRNDLWRFGGEMYIGYEDGTSEYRDKFGRTSKAHEYLMKPIQTENPGADDPCGCGSGISFSDCCADVASHRRPSWSVLSIRERNLGLMQGIKRILGLDKENATWLEVRKKLSNEQVCEIHQLYAALWPTDTQLLDLLPSPQTKRSRALFLGSIDARTFSTSVRGMLAYVDELVVVHPFANANGIRPEYSPVHHPERFRAQTLRSVFVLMLLEPYIAAGRIHLVPDPMDYDAGFRSEIIDITKNSIDKLEPGPVDLQSYIALHHGERMRAIKRLPFSRLKAHIRKSATRMPELLIDANVESIANIWKKEIEDDPLSLLDPPLSSDEGGEIMLEKSFTRETGLFIATLTGSIIYTNSDTQWKRLLETDGVHYYEPDPKAENSVRFLDNLYLKLPSQENHDEIDSNWGGEVRVLLRRVAIALRTGIILDTDAVDTGRRAYPPEEAGVLMYRLRAFVPQIGFQRVDVSRLLLTFGRLADVEPVQLALFLEPVLQESENFENLHGSFIAADQA